MTNLRYQEMRRSRLMREYGITAEEYAEMLLDQDGVCALCGKPETRVVRSVVSQLSVDHDHETGQVRGLLCAKCNMDLGNFEKMGIDNILIYLGRVS